MRLLKPVALLVAMMLATADLSSQSTSGEILGAVRDPSGAVVNGAVVTIRNLETNAVTQVENRRDGRFRFALLPIGSYEITVDKVGFAQYLQAPITLRLNQQAELEIRLELLGVEETLSVSADAPLINTTSAEVGVNFDSRRVAELPLAPNRNILNLALQVAGVSQLSSGNIDQASGGVNFSVNGSRLRSNNFLIDGQDSNHLNNTGLVQEINNPDSIAEFRLITNQFAPEYGRASGSVVNIITKTGTNVFHGSAYWFYNSNVLNSRSNLDKRLFKSAPWRVENQFAGTLGGPIRKDRTFFFGSLLRWTDHRFASGTSITGAPTVEGQNRLRSVAGVRPQVQALLKFLPAAQSAPTATKLITVAGQNVEIPVGTLSGSAPNRLDVWQSDGRVDHAFSTTQNLGARYLFDDRYDISGQAVPSGLTDQRPQRRQAATAFFNIFRPGRYNELRSSYQRLSSSRTVVDSKAEEIPSIEIIDLGLIGINPAPSRTAIGVPTVLPLINATNTYQLSDVFGLLRQSHSFKFGIDFRREEQNYILGTGNRGRLQYTTLQDFVDDIAQEAQISLTSLSPVYHFRYYDYAFFLQDEWRARQNLTLTYGTRYESAGTPVDDLAGLSRQLVDAHKGDADYGLSPIPRRDRNNWAPRFGFNYRFGKWPGVLAAVSGDGELVVRGGYSRAYDLFFNQIFQNVAGGFPFTTGIRPTARSASSSFAYILGVRTGAIVPSINLAGQTRNIVGEDFRSPSTEQYSLQFQRGIGDNWAAAIGWIATKGTALFQTVDGNPTLPVNNANGTRRVDSNRGVVRLRCNCASSIYHSMQSSLEKRFSAGFSMAAHYTWSAFIDDASDVFNASNFGDVALSQDFFNRHADRGRSTYDRPHRLSVNGVLELPQLRMHRGLLARLAGGWQFSGFLTLQSGAPFSALAGSDPGFRVTGISGQVGNPVRPNLNTKLDVSSMTLEELLRSGGSGLFSQVTVASPLGNAGRNILRADGIGRVDLGINKNWNFHETNRLQIRAEFYNLFNSRDFGIPDAAITSPGFGNQWNTDGGNRRVVAGIRYTF
jgi:Carboxypeptidase regulatory-like domain/TonB dependent receptor